MRAIVSEGLNLGSFSCLREAETEEREIFSLFGIPGYGKFFSGRPGALGSGRMGEMQVYQTSALECCLRSCSQGRFQREQSLTRRFLMHGQRSPFLVELGISKRLKGTKNDSHGLKLRSLSAVVKCPSGQV